MPIKPKPGKKIVLKPATKPATKTKTKSVNFPEPEEQAPPGRFNVEVLSADEAGITVRFHANGEARETKSGSFIRASTDRWEALPGIGGRAAFTAALIWSPTEE